MSILNPQRAKIIGLVALMAMSALGLSACLGAQSTPSSTPPVVIITQVVTQIIPPTPKPATATPEPTATTPPPTASPTFDPMAAVIYYPLPDCVASRLHVGDVAMVSYVGGPNGIRYGRDMAEGTVFAYADPGALLEIVDGPFCSRGWIVWMVRMADGQEGFTPEGDGNTYWLLPTAPHK